MKKGAWKFLPTYDELISGENKQIDDKDVIVTIDVRLPSDSERYEKLYGIKREEGETEEEHKFRVENGYEERQILIKYFKERGYNVE